MAKKKCVAYSQEDFLYIDADGSNLIKTKIIIKKYVKYLKRSYLTVFAHSTQNHNKMAVCLVL
jgi:hypothetical protein